MYIQRVAISVPASAARRIGAESIAKSNQFIPDREFVAALTESGKIKIVKEKSNA